MNTKEKLTEIIGNVVVNDKGNRIRDVFHPEFVEKIVKDLIKNGVIVQHYEGTKEAIGLMGLAQDWVEFQKSLWRLDEEMQEYIDGKFAETMKELEKKGGKEDA